MIDVRDRQTERINRARLSLEVKRAVRPLLVVAIGAAAGLLFWAVQVQEVGQYLIRESRELRFAVDDATGVVAKRQEVRFKGIPAGTITGVEMERGQPVLTVQVRKEFGPVYRDARAKLRPNTALEDMYLDIVDRGSRRTGEATPAAPLPARQTDTSVQVEEVLQVFNPEARTHMGALLRDLGGGLDGRGEDLREAFVTVIPFLRAAAGMTDQLAERSRQTSRLVHKFSILSGELARRDRELRTLTSEGGRTLRTLAAGSRDLDATLRALPPALGELDTSFAAVRGVLPDVDSALTSLRPVAGRLPEGLSALRRLSDTAGPAVDALRRPVKALVPLARAARPFSANLEQALGAIGPQTGSVDHSTRSTVPCLQPLLYFFIWDVSQAKFQDSRGIFPRGDLAIGAGSNPAVRDPLMPALKEGETCAPGTPKGAEP